MMNSLKKSLLVVYVKLARNIFMLFPLPLSLWIGRCLGCLAYYFSGRKRKVVYANLKTVFAQEKSPQELRYLSREVFINFVQSSVEFFCLPKIKRLGLSKFVNLQGREHLEEASSLGRGIILLAIHSGSWEIASVVGGITKGPYHVVVNHQSKIPELDKLLNEYRTIAGANVITAGVAAKEIIRAIRNNEVVSLVLDQGGRLGLEVPFLGKSASMSTGAIRLALKYGCAVCPVWIERCGNGQHHLKVFPALSLVQTGNLESDLKSNVIQAAAIFEKLLREHPSEYMWFYKVFKYSKQALGLIIDDGRTGHLRQSQSLSRNLKEVLKRKGKSFSERIVALQWKSKRARTIFSLFAFLAQYLDFLQKEEYLRFFLTKDSFDNFMKYKADFIVSCGSQAAGINFILSKNCLARSISVLTPGIISPERFDVVVMPEHDNPVVPKRARLIIPKVSPNLINAQYLKEQEEGLLNHYSHLKGNVRTKFGILIGGNANGVKFDEELISELIDQVKKSAVHYNAEILLTTSRRTPANIEQIIAKELKGFERCALCIIANQRNVPEAVGGILGMSDLVIVSGESISMVSEALSSGKRTIVFSPQGEYKDKPRDKYEDFVLKLNDQGYLMSSSIYDIKAKISQLLSYKISLKSLDDQVLIQSGLEASI